MFEMLMSLVAWLQETGTKNVLLFAFFVVLPFLASVVLVVHQVIY